MILQEKYNRDDFLAFQKQFLPDFTKDIRPINSRGLQVTKDVFQLGYSEKLDLKVFEFKHASSSDPRISLTKDGFRVMKDSATYLALAVYHSENSDDWRLSLMIANPEINEKGKVRQLFSNPRRYSFFLGPKAQIHTPGQYLVTLGQVKDFEDLKKRFSIEVVNKDFYTEIALLFTELAGGKRTIGKKTINAGRGLLNLPSTLDDILDKEFTVRLIGRVVFCWFLKKKRSDSNVSLLPEELLSVKAVIENKGYYHSILEPLFFEVLNTPLNKREKKYQCSPWSQIPFLNGGLFTPHHYDYYEIGPLGISKYINTLKIPDHWIRKLFEIFETYNFTIDENTSVDIELSIEPEMLGRIFENLLAEINPETGETARKTTGSYYTPRQIVEYMVDESIKQYLLVKTKLVEDKIRSLLTYEGDELNFSESEKEGILDALDTVKVIDPACGSGAFPMGMLQKMLLILQKVDSDSQNWLDKKLATIPDIALRKELKAKLKTDNFNYIHKIGIIRDSIYGVDIQPIAVEISKLRFFLSLIVDEKVDDFKDNRGIKPLPNLEFKFVCANSLIGLPKKEQQKGFEEANEDIALLKDIRNNYLGSYGSEKKRLEKKFTDVQSRMTKHVLSWALWGSEKSQTMKLVQWNPFSEESCGWFDPDWMFGIKDGFDIVIANPPYVFARNSMQKGLTEKDKEFFYKNYQLAEYQLNLYPIFIERSVQMLQPNGHLAFITPNNWLTINTNKLMRRFVLQKSNITIVNFYAKVFESAAVDSAVILFAKEQSRPVVRLYEFTDSLHFIKEADCSYFLNQKDHIISIEAFKGDGISELLSKIEVCSDRLESLCDVKAGLKAYEVGKGNPPQTEKMKENRIYHSIKKQGNNCYKYLDGKDVCRYYIGWSGEYLQYGDNLAAPRKNFALYSTKRVLVRQIPAKPPYCLRNPLILSTHSATHCPANPLYAGHLSERSDACFFIISKNVFG